jgi:hypothetical protein
MRNNNLEIDAITENGKKGLVNQIQKLIQEKHFEGYVVSRDKAHDIDVKKLSN